MAHQQTNSVLVYVRMYAVTERGVKYNANTMRDSMSMMCSDLMCT